MVGAKHKHLVCHVPIRLRHRSTRPTRFSNGSHPRSHLLLTLPVLPPECLSLSVPVLLLSAKKREVNFVVRASRVCTGCSQGKFVEVVEKDHDVWSNKIHLRLRSWPKDNGQDRQIAALIAPYVPSLPCYS